MARSLSWIDPDHLTELIDVVSPEKNQPQTSNATDTGELDSALLSEVLPDISRDTSRPTSSASPAPSPRSPSSATKAVRRPAAAPTAPTRPSAAVSASPAQGRPVPARQTVAAKAQPVPGLVPFRPAQGGALADNLKAFTKWLVGFAPIEGVVVTDADGLVIAEEKASEIDAIMTSSVAILLNHVGDVLQSEVDGYVALQRQGRHLITLWTETEYGRLFSVLISNATPQPRDIEVAGQGFRSLFAK